MMGGASAAHALWNSPRRKPLSQAAHSCAGVRARTGTRVCVTPLSFRTSGLDLSPPPPSPSPPFEQARCSVIVFRLAVIFEHGQR